MGELQWYVVHTYSGHEAKAKKLLEKEVEHRGLEELFGEILVPVEKVTEMRSGKKSTQNKKFLPSYILIQVDLNNETQHLVTSTPGITSFVGSGGKPVPITEAEAKRVMGQMDKAKAIEEGEFPFKTGDAVKVTDGPFTDFSGFISEINMERKKVKVMVSIFGRPTPVELDFLQIGAAT
jgi:transcriptional antiterminator NusG